MVSLIVLLQLERKLLRVSWVTECDVVAGSGSYKDYWRWTWPGKRWLESLVVSYIAGKEISGVLDSVCCSEGRKKWCCLAAMGYKAEAEMKLVVAAAGNDVEQEKALEMENSSAVCWPMNEFRCMLGQGIAGAVQGGTWFEIVKLRRPRTIGGLSLVTVCEGFREILEE
ncbi:hypothetical protein C5167_012163 [Papaver somniferum]|uniref:Uncharacterized protein n=1 Tax=Papaver somniferum TaxID=3469 RepID=A0A4Y7IZW8_PAPSO|nr:hypothetical protein C5167_012163 [Papaver somniferum]